MKQYIPEVCEHCNQTKTYTLDIDRGTVEILKAISTFIRQKGINVVHPRKEMEGEYLSSNQVGNLSRARFHGLIAKVQGNAGNYLLTHKGSQFLNGKKILRTAIISKAEGHQIGYYETGDENVDYCSVHEFADPEKPYWEGCGYQISEGNVIEPSDIKMTQPIIFI